MIFSNVRKELPVAQRLRGQNNFNASPNKYRNKSNNARNIDRKRVAIRKFFRSDVERIERVGAVGAVFEECSFSAGYESGKPMTSDSASFSPPLSLRKPLRPRLTPAA